MFEVINDTDKEVVEIDILNKYVKYIVKKLEKIYLNSTFCFGI